MLCGLFEVSVDDFEVYFGIGFVCFVWFVVVIEIVWCMLVEKVEEWMLIDLFGVVEDCL